MKAFSGNIKAGILGGGQLGRMLLQEAVNLNIPFDILDPDPDAPCKDLAKRFVAGSLADFDTVMEFGKGLDLITIEIEKVNADALEQLQQQGVTVFPQPEIIRLIQDKGLQKQFFTAHGIPTAPYKLFGSAADLRAGDLSFPCIQKLRKDGYDGRGVMKISSREDLTAAFDAPCITEDMIDFQKEISVIVTRGVTGETKTFPCVEMEFNPDANLVEFLVSPAELPGDIAGNAAALAIKIAHELKMTGTLAVEMFLTRTGELLVNELAPRPHNSGHQSIEGNVTSQFAQHLRAIFGLPLGSTACNGHAVMVNLLGEPGFEGEAIYDGLEEALKMEGVYIHLYGKKLTKPMRKMGHITVTGRIRTDVIEKARTVQKLLRVIA